jgi:hypothetical protein
MEALPHQGLEEVEELRNEKTTSPDYLNVCAQKEKEEESCEMQTNEREKEEVTCEKETDLKEKKEQTCEKEIDQKGEKKRGREMQFVISGRHQILVAKMKSVMKPKVRPPKVSEFEIDINDWESAQEWSQAFQQRVGESPPFSKDPIPVQSPTQVAMKSQEKVVLWQVIFRTYEEFRHLLTKDDCCRTFGKQCCFMLLNQTVQRKHKFQVTCVAVRIYDYETSDVYGLDVIPSSVTFIDRYYLRFSFQIFMTTTTLRKKLQ